MRILVSGGAGFIGSNIVDAYIQEGHDVAVVDNMSTGSWDNINPQAQFYNCDIRDSNSIKKVLDEFAPQIINHHAAQIDVRKSTADPVYDAEVNIIGFLNIIKSAIESHVEKFIYASSGGAVYGEPEYLPADEKHPIRPISEYGVSKHIIEHYLHVYASNYNMNYTVLRYANVYGPRQNIQGEGGVIAVFIGKMLEDDQPVIFGSGEATRDYVYVADVVDANVYALSQGDQITVNIGTQVETSVNTVYHLVADVLGYEKPPVYAPARIGEIERTYLRNALANDLLGWEPKTPINAGILKTVEFAKSDYEKIAV